MPASVRHLHTYFLFPFSIDQEAVREADAAVWDKRPQWIDGLDEWIASHPAPALAWKRTPYSEFDLDSRAYQDMVFFHPIVRRVFFDTVGQAQSREALIRCYTMRPPNEAKLWFEAGDSQLSVSINRVRGMNYAGIFGEERPHGFTTEIEVVRKLLAELYDEGKGGIAE